MARLYNPVTGQAIEVDLTDREATRRAADRLIETPEQWLIRGIRRRLGRLAAWRPWPRKRQEG